MKKTLAAVLAAAMALSTATVALATDYESEFDTVSGSVTTGDEIWGIMGDSKSFIITSITDIERINEIPGKEMAAAIKEGYVTPSVIVTSGRDKLSGIPTLRVGDYAKPGAEVLDYYVWRADYDGNPANHTLESLTENWPKEVKRTIGVGKKVTAFCVDMATVNGGPASPADSDDIAAGTYQIVREGDALFNSCLQQWEYGARPMTDGSKVGWVKKVTKTETSKEFDPELKIAFNHTYGTGTSTADLRLRFTVKKSVTLGDLEYAKGDTITTEVVTAKAKYYDMDNLHTDMQLTLDERNARKVLLNGADLYNEIGNSAFTVTFGDDIAMFEGKAASNQKTVNLWYDIDRGDDANTYLTDTYSDVDFTFIEFRGTPAFQNTGKMYFAAKDENTTVYEWDGEAWNPMTGKFDPTYKTVEVKGVKRLGKYAIASEILEDLNEEPEEPAEPVDSTPVAEPDDDEGQNPNTGAC